MLEGKKVIAFGDGQEYTSGQWASVNGQTQAVDVFYGISSTYDFYLTLFGRHSIDGSDGYFRFLAESGG